MYILPFEQIGKEDAALAGGKGANLGELTKAGFPVPPGAVLTTAAYDAFLTASLITTEGRGIGAADIRERILNGKFPDDVRAELRAFCRRVKGRPLAVRSSAALEGLTDLVFAGQQETFLDVVGEEELLARIRDCYASLYSEKAVSYRTSRGYGKKKVKLAVVLQAMVESSVSGVLFTRNPLKPGKDEMVITSSYGLVEWSASENVSPDEIVCRCDGELLSVRIGGKRTMAVPSGSRAAREAGARGKRGDIVRLPVPQEEQDRCSLTKEQVEQLADLGMNVEVHYGRPMDIEWTFAGGGLWVLRAGRIMAVSGEESSRQTAGEKESDVLGRSRSELSGPVPDASPQPDRGKKSGAAPRLRRLKGKEQQRMIRVLGDIPAAFYPLDYDFGWLAGMQQDEVLRGMGMPPAVSVSLDENGFTVLSRNKGRRLPHLARSAMMDTLGSTVLPASEKKITAGILPYTDSGKNLEVLRNARKSFREGFDALREEAREAGELCRAGGEQAAAACVNALSDAHLLIRKVSYLRFRYAVIPGMFLGGQLDGYLKHVGLGHSSYELLGGLPYKTAAMSWALFETAGKVRADGEKRQALLNARDLGELKEKDPGTGGELEAFLKKYGKRQDFGRYCFAARSLEEEPGRLLTDIRPMLREGAMEGISQERGKLQYEMLLRDLHDTVGKDRFLRLESRIELCRKYQVYQEENQYLLECIFYECRRLIAALTRLLALNNEDDLLFLRFEELCALGRAGRLTPELSEKISRRSALRGDALRFWEYQKAEVLRAGQNGTKMTGSLQIKGMPICNGQAIGKVRIIGSPEEFNRLEKGDILVCPFITPDYLPLLTLAGAVVSDTGSVLSGAAIAAAECGVPAVLCCGNAVSLLSDGEEVMVNGRTGVIQRN